MPFPNQTPVPFTPAGIQQLASGFSGCYGIFGNGQWLYVGRSNNLRERLLVHLTDPVFTQYGATHVVTLLNPSPEALEKALILELRPLLNQKVG